VGTAALSLSRALRTLALGGIERVCMSARTVTVFGEVYEARFPFLTKVTRLGSVAILKFFHLIG